MNITKIGLALLGVALLLHGGCGCGDDDLWALGEEPGPDPETLSYVLTLDGQFDEGALLNVNHDAPNGDQLQLNAVTEPFPFINVAASHRGTVVRVTTDTGEIVGEYRVAPEGRGLDPSRTTVDLFGNVWTGNRSEIGPLGEKFGGGFPALADLGVSYGSVVKIGLVVGGTRGNKNPDGSFTPDPTGEYLQPPFSYSTAVDRDGDGLIRTSRGLGHILAWPDVTDGVGGTDNAADDARVEDALDECILVYQRTPDALQVRHVSVDANNDVWIGGYLFSQDMFHKLDETTGAILDSFDAREFGAGGYGGLIDANGVLWSASKFQSTLLRYDIAAGTGTTINVQDSYGLGIDTNGYLWNSTYCDNHVLKIAPDGTVEPGFPKAVPGGNCLRGVAVTPLDNHIWVVNSHGTTVARLDNDGNLLKTISVGDGPTGVAVDANGKVWATNLDSNDLSRIDPNGGGDGLGEVDLTVDLGPGAGPYNYSDMTGAVAIGTTSPQGMWTVTQDSGIAGPTWTSISWNTEPEGSEPPGTSIEVEARAAETATGLTGEAFVPVTNGAPLGLTGQFIEVRVTLKRGTSVESPVLSDVILMFGT